MFLKVLQGNTVIDVIENVLFVEHQDRNDLNVLGSEARAFGIMSSDMSTIWHTEDLADVPEGTECETVEVAEITEEEYTALRRELDAGNVVEEEEPAEDTPEEGEQEDTEVVMTPTEMRLRINELTATVEALTAEKDMLMECVLEMSAVVYA